MKPASHLTEYPQEVGPRFPQACCINFICTVTRLATVQHEMGELALREVGLSVCARCFGGNQSTGGWKRGGGQGYPLCKNPHRASTKGLPRAATRYPIFPCISAFCTKSSTDMDHLRYFRSIHPPNQRCACFSRV